MNILHGTWIPEHTDNYVRKGAFYLWVETDSTDGRKKEEHFHPACLEKNRLEEFFKGELGIKEPDKIKEKYFILPTLKSTPLPSYELLRHSEEELPENFQLKGWKIFCYEVKSSEILKILKDINFLFFYNPGETRAGTDILFWYHYTQLFKEIILKDRYIPSLKYRELNKNKKKKNGEYEIYPYWEIISEKYEGEIEKQTSFMPQICVAGSDIKEKGCKFFSKKTILSHFSENLLNEIIWNTDFTAQFTKEIHETFLYDCIFPFDIKYNIKSWRSSHSLEEYKKWYLWKEQLVGNRLLSKFTLCFKLEEAFSMNDKWKINFLLEFKEDPSLKIKLQDYWHMDKNRKKGIQDKFGSNMEKEILLNLGYAAKMYPRIWKGLDTDKPEGFKLDIEEAFEFLKESAWILEDSGYKVIIPSWYTPKGQRKAKIKVKTSVKHPGSASKSFFGLDAIVEYSYDLAIGSEVVSQKEWNDLVNAKQILLNSVENGWNWTGIKWRK